MKLKVTVDGKSYEVEVELLDGEQPLPATPVAPVESKPAEQPAAPKEEPKAEPAKPATSAGSGAVVKSPIAGTVTKVNVAVGDQVQKNQAVVVLEAMKMESDVASPHEGVVKVVHVQAGQTVAQNQVLVEFE